jgi:simple sugar transport system ATP-binding protein
MERPPAVELQGVSKRFGVVQANDGVDLRVRRGQIHAVIGENGAGKSTALAIMFGIHSPDRGQVFIDGVSRHLHSPRDAIRLGLGMVHQHFSLVPTLTVAENVVLGAEPRRWLAIDRQLARTTVRNVATSLGLELDPDRRVDELGIGERQWVEIVKALSRDAATLLLDEPTAVLTPQESDRLLDMLARLRDEGRTIVLVTHRLAEVFSHADHVTVMRAGHVVFSKPAAESSHDEVAYAMIGRQLAPALKRAPAHSCGDVVVRVRDLTVEAGGRNRLRGVSLDLHAGEIVGVAGVEGNGQQELADVVAGRLQPTSGTLENRCSTRTAYIPADRTEVGLVAEMSLAENAILGRQRDPHFYCGFTMDRGRIEERAARLATEFAVKCASIHAPVCALSGGNQQKFLAGRELSDAPGLVVAAQPTRGVDVGAAELVREALAAARDRGAAVLLISSDLDELLELSDRVLVLFRGRVVAERAPSETSASQLGLDMAGAGGIA